jgi:hypothetical protein
LRRGLLTLLVVYLVLVCLDRGANVVVDLSKALGVDFRASAIKDTPANFIITVDSIVDIGLYSLRTVGDGILI